MPQNISWFTYKTITAILIIIVKLRLIIYKCNNVPQLKQHNKISVRFHGRHHN